MPPLPFRTTRLALLGGALAAGLAACGEQSDLFLGQASSNTVLLRLVLYPLSGDATLPAAIDLAGQRVVRPAILGGAVLNFDLAVDLDAQGRVVVLPASKVAVPLTGAPRTGLQIVGATFDALTKAPSGGYGYDAGVTVNPGQTVAIQASAATCSSSYPLYAKLVVDSVGRAAVPNAARPIYLQVRVDPNCGFRGLEEGLPKS